MSAPGSSCTTCQPALHLCCSPPRRASPQVVDGASQSPAATSSPVLSFTTPPPPGSNATFTWLMAADVGQAQVDGSSVTMGIKPGAMGVSQPARPAAPCPPAPAPWRRTGTATARVIPTPRRTRGAHLTTPGHPSPCPQNFRGMARAAAAARPGLVSYSGDISYSDGAIGDWELFLENAAPVLGVAPVLVQQGNHERDA